VAAIRNRIQPYIARAMLLAAVSIAFAACGNSSSVVITAQSFSNTTIMQAHLTAGTYSIQLNDCAKPASGQLLLVPQNGHGGFLMIDAIALQDGSTVPVSTAGVYGVLGLNTGECYPATVTLTLK
jgi:hypothetical protein